MCNIVEAPLNERVHGLAARQSVILRSDKRTNTPVVWNSTPRPLGVMSQLRRGRQQQPGYSRRLQ